MLDAWKMLEDCQVNPNLAPAVLLRHVDVDLYRLALLEREVELLGRLLLLLRDLLLDPNP